MAKDIGPSDTPTVRPTENRAESEPNQSVSSPCVTAGQESCDLRQKGQPRKEERSNQALPSYTGEGKEGFHWNKSEGGRKKEGAGDEKGKGQKKRRALGIIMDGSR